MLNSDLEDYCLREVSAKPRRKIDLVDICDSNSPIITKRINGPRSEESQLGSQLRKCVVDDSESDEIIITSSEASSRKRMIIVSSDDEEEIVKVKRNNRKIEIDSDEEQQEELNQASSPSSIIDLTTETLHDYLDELKFFNQCTTNELSKLLNLDDPERLDLFFKMRPFKSIEDLENKFKKNKLNVLSSRYNKLLDGFKAVDELILSTKLFLSQKTKPHNRPLDFQSVLNKEIQLKDYQQIGISWLFHHFLNNCGVILADEMGLGKTCQVIALLAKVILHLDYEGPHLIVVPASVLENWSEEFEKFCSRIKVLIYKGTQKERESIRSEYKYHKLKFNVIISTYNLISSDKYDRQFIKGLKLQSIILDEAHLIKNYQSQNYLFLIKLEAKFRLLLTGTPLQNNLLELLNLLIFINPDVYDQGLFKDILSSKVLVNKHDISKSINQLFQLRVDKMKQIMLPFVLRRVKEQVLKSLPNKQEKIIYCEMDSIQAKAYKDIAVKVGSWNQLNPALALNITSRLRRTANHTLLIPYGHYFSNAIKKKIAKDIIKDPKFSDSDPIVIYQELLEYSDSDIMELCSKYKAINKYNLKDEEWMHSCKIDWIKENVPKMIEEGDKFLIFSQFTMVLEILSKVLETLNVQHFLMDGATSVDERQSLINEFNNNNDIKVFLLSTKAAACGINLTAANKVIIHDLHHNPQNDKQAEARAHRVGQTRDVTVYKLIAKDTLEEEILELGNAKLDLHSSIHEDDANNCKAILQSLSSKLG